MTTTIVKAKRRAQPAPMTADEAEAAVRELQRTSARWIELLVELHVRQAAQALGFASTKDLLADRLKITAGAAYVVLRAAMIRVETARLTSDRREQRRILELSDHAAKKLRRLPRTAARGWPRFARPRRWRSKTAAS